MKRFFSLLLLLILILALALPVFAQEKQIVDQAGLLTASEATALELRAQELRDSYAIDTVILTVDSLDGADAERYADDYYDNHDYGCGSDYSGVLLLLAMDTREWAISTCGDGIYALTDYGIECIFSEIAPDLAADDYYRAFDRYLSELERYYRDFSRGTPQDDCTTPYSGPGTYVPGTGEGTVHYAASPRRSILKMLTIALLFGAVVGSIAILGMRRAMHTSLPQTGAANYVTPGSFHLTHQQDIFLGTHTTRTPRQQASSGSTSHSGGGSSVHHSSSGRSHGGGHGRF